MLAIACTDLDWFEQLAADPAGSIVNFWTPTPWKVSALADGDLFYFMLKAPVRKIGGHGRFVTYKEMTADQAWREYGLSNGVHLRSELTDRVRKYVTKNTRAEPVDDPVIGCIELTDLVMLDEESFFAPEDYGFPFPKQIVKYKTFNASSIPYQNRASGPATDFALVQAGARRRRNAPVSERHGQRAFRDNILKAYGRRCCITGERIPQLLHAAHIQPYICQQSNHVQNGLCLRIDMHWLFDKGLIALSDTFELIASKELADTSYQGIAGQRIHLPADPSQWPSLEALEYHRAEVFSSKRRKHGAGGHRPTR